VPLDRVGDESRDVDLARSGDPEAFERLYRCHVPRVYALACRMTDTGAADDLTQEIFIRAWQKLGTFGGRSQFSTWLHRLAINLILSRRKSMGKRKERHVGLETVQGKMGRAPERTGDRIDVEDAIRTLPGRAREVFVLYDVEGYPHQEIAQLLGISVGTSKSQLHRARLMMRERLV